MKKIEWGMIGICSRCGKKATVWFAKITFFKKIHRYYCDKCLLNTLFEEGLEPLNKKFKKKNQN